MSKLTREALAIVLAEPSDTQCKIIRRALESTGVRHIREVHCGAEVLSLARAEAPDVVVSALHLPDMSAAELISMLRHDAELGGTAFVLISSETRLRYLDPIRQAGAAAILGKPFSSAELELALDAAIDLVDQSDMSLCDYEPELLNVLLVDDSPLARKHVRRVLEGMGFERFAEVANGREALAAFADQHYDLIVTDYNMPEMDGCELVQTIRERSGQSSVPILMVTSEDSQSRLTAVEQAGVSAICDKPFEPANVRGLLQRILTNVA